MCTISILVQVQLHDSICWESLLTMRFSTCSLQFIFFNAVSIVLDVLRLAMAPDGMHGFFLLVLLQIAGMLCKVHICGVMDDCPACSSGPDTRTSCCWLQHTATSLRRHM